MIGKSPLLAPDGIGASKIKRKPIFFPGSLAVFQSEKVGLQRRPGPEIGRRLDGGPPEAGKQSPP